MSVHGCLSLGSLRSGDLLLLHLLNTQQYHYQLSFTPPPDSRFANALITSDLGFDFILNRPCWPHDEYIDVELSKWRGCEADLTMVQIGSPSRKSLRSRSDNYVALDTTIIPSQM